jgi:hypothetical protein
MSGFGNGFETEALPSALPMGRLNLTEVSCPHANRESCVSSGSIRLTNEDVIDRYSRVMVGTRVVVLPGRPGPGLGLAFSRKLARMMGGERDRDERAGQGVSIYGAPSGRRGSMIEAAGVGPARDVRFGIR